MICKDVIVQCIYYTVYTIYMMSQTFIPWVIIKKDFIQSFAFDMSDGENHREADSDIRTFQSTTLSTNLCIRNFNKWDPWCKQAQSRLVFLLTCTVYLKAMVRLRGRAHRSCIEVCESQKISKQLNAIYKSLHHCLLWLNKKAQAVMLLQSETPAASGPPVRCIWWL